MSTSANILDEPLAVGVSIDHDRLTVDLTDGRSISVPLAWYPRLARGAQREQAHWILVGSGRGIHWPDLDEDISIDALLEGRASNESQERLTGP